jgi:CDP-diacylglycerol--glycerol-3-phosphate 3-phosphatidyltransferase
VTRANTANALSSSRFVLSPIFVVFFVLAAAYPSAALGLLIAALVVYILIEVSDILDGMVARSANAVSDIGKILDPFADVVSKATYFACLLTVEIVPLWFFLVFLYREFGIILIRLILITTGTALGARSLGKIKTWLYGLTALVGFLIYSLQLLSGARDWSIPWLDAPWLSVGFTVLLGITALLAVVSFAEYLVLFVRQRKRNS